MRKTLCLPWALMAAAALAGCERPAVAPPQPGPAAPQPAEGPAVTTVRPERKTVRHPIEQPGFNIEAFQETALYAKVSGYVGKWNVDIGASVKKGDVLAELDVPEMVVEVKQKEAAARQAEAQVAQAKAAELTARARLDRAKSQYERLARVGQGGVLDRENVDEARLGYEAARADVAKAAADVTAAGAAVEVAKANRDYARTMLRYTEIRAPYDGIVTQRNVNDRDFVRPADAGVKGRPLYVVQQFDPVRVFVNVPGADAAWVNDGDPVSLRLHGAGGELFQGTVTRNARALDPQARTLRTEIDVPNPGHRLKPGMYVQARITVEHRDVWTLPAAAVLTEGDQTFCYTVAGGQAVRTPLQVGLRGGGLVEVLKKQARPSGGAEGPWEAISGAEEVVAGNAAALRDGQPIRRAPTAP
jgi:RND family efflux transporter MFP subunit